MERFIVVETKGEDERADYEANQKTYRGKLENLTNEILAKEIGFNDFQSVNKNFEYHIIFNSSFQREQLKLLDLIRKT